MPAQRTPEALASLALATIESILTDPQASASVRLKAALAILNMPPKPQPDNLPGSAQPETSTTEPPAKPQSQPVPQPDPLRYSAYTPSKPLTIRHDQPKTGRNDLCPCGSNLKFKRCCLNKPHTLATAA